MKKLVSVFSALFIAALLSVTAFANQVTDIDVDVTLNEDGSAKIHQVWHGFFDDGTECYYPFITRKTNYIENLTVSDEKGVVYGREDFWDVDASFEEKKNKCGLNDIDGGYEVCWGISDYGEKTYTIGYTVTNVVGAYKDSDGFNFRFVNPEMNTTPTSVTLTVRLYDGTAVTDENCNIWAFGFDGDINFSDGKVIAKTAEPLGYNNHVTVMMEFKKGIFTPLNVIDKEFDSIKKAAFKGSDYNVTDPALIIVFVILGIVAFILVAAGVYSLIINMRIKRFYKKCDYYREAPKDLDMSFALLYSVGYCKESSIIGARILSLVAKGFIEPVSQKGVFRDKTVFRISDEYAADNTQRDNILFNILDAAAGEDNLLVPDEMKKYCDRNPKRLRKFIDGSYSEGIRALEKIGWRKKRSKVSVEDYPELITNKSYLYRNIKKYSDTGKEELAKLFGLKKYLEDFSLIAERETKEVFVWQDYLVYATLLGIADKVLSEFKKVYPESVAEIESYRRDITFSNNCRMYMYASMSRREQINAARNSGSGGSASFGGGGGFLGGGIGGGTR